MMENTLKSEDLWNLPFYFWRMMLSKVRQPEYKILEPRDNLKMMPMKQEVMVGLCKPLYLLSDHSMHVSTSWTQIGPVLECDIKTTN